MGAHLLLGLDIGELLPSVALNHALWDTYYNMLPLSRFDDDIRVKTHRSIARMGGLGRYLQGANPSLHIVVDNGHVTLEGVVANDSDRTLANMAARQVSGVFSVKNNLRTDRESGIG